MSELTDLERAHYNRICELEASIREFDVAYQMAKARAADAKKDLELAIIDLRLCISKGPNQQQRLDLKLDWQDEPISKVISCTEKQLDKLHEAGVETVGQFEVVRAGKDKRYPGGIIDLPGIGVSTLDKWEEQMIDWLIKNSAKDEPDGD